LRRSTFRLGGKPHQLLVLADLRRALREEERQAWQRLVRVLGHEINNSLAPIHSIAQSVQETLHSPHDGWKEDVASGLQVIERRAESLSRFMTSYARLARLPPPRLGPVEVEEWVRRIAALEKRLPVGLALSRQIAELHQGTLSLENRGDRAGARARLRLPLKPG